MTSIRTCLLALAAALALLAGPACAEDAAALAFLRSVYHPYQSSASALDIGSEEEAARYFVPAVAKLIARDIAESSERNEVGRLDFDPFVGGQDWQPMRIDLAVRMGPGPTRAVATARYKARGEAKPTVVTLDLQKLDAGWRIADIRWSGQAESLVQILSKEQ